MLIIVFAIISDVSDFGNQFSSMPKWVRALLVIIAFVVWDGYFVLFEWLWRGQTPGKRWLKLRVYPLRPSSQFFNMVRNLVRLADIIVPPVSPRYCLVLRHPLRQRRRRLVAGTVVVRERQAEAPAFTEVFASPISDPALRRSFKPVPFTADVNNLTEQEISVVESFLYGGAGI